MKEVQPIRDKKKIEKMKKYLKSKSTRDWVLFVLGINSGLRISDILSLQVEDVAGKDRIALQEKKTNKTKNFPLADSVKKAIAEYLAEKKLTKGPLFPSRKHDGSNSSGSISRQQAWEIINAAAKEAKVADKIGTHSLRKTFGYHAYQSGVSIETIQKLLNHSAPSVTLAYIGITREQLDEVYINLNL
ncbi:MAG: site-specific integrase [Sporomusaceae bacterium]|nr:site-specific integrase [Sporomusaceae bacterium]